MIKTYTIYNTSTGTISGRVSCPESMAYLQVKADESLLEGEYSHYEYKVESGSAVTLSDIEKDVVLFSERENSIPSNLDTSLNDTELNSFISEYFLGRVDVATWRLENYKSLRELAYPDYKNTYLDAMVKMSSTDPSLQAEGSLQLQQYYTDCLTVKQRFPKE